LNRVAELAIRAGVSSLQAFGLKKSNGVPGRRSRRLDPRKVRFARINRILGDGRASVWRFLLAQRTSSRVELPRRDKVQSVKALSDFRLEVRSADGTAGVICVADRLFGPMFEPLKDPAAFAQVFVDEYGAVCWPNGADMAPDALYDEISGKTQVA
jgi:hypothetical protein